MESSVYYRVADFGAVGDGATDDTAAINAAIAACVQERGGVVSFDAKTYLVNGALQGEAGHRCRLLVPAPVWTAPDAAWTTVELRGAHLPPQVFGTVGKTSMPECGTVIKSTARENGGAMLGAGAADFALLTLKLSNLTFRTTDNPQQSAVDARAFVQFIAENLQIDTSVYAVQAAEPTAADVFGLRTPATSNGALTVLRNVAVSGYWGGIEVFEHTYGDYLNLTANRHGLVLRPTHHASFFDRVAAQRNQNAVTVAGFAERESGAATSSSATTAPAAFSIRQLNLEHPGDDQLTPETAWQSCDGVQGFDLRDEANLGIGEITWWTVRGNVGSVAQFYKSAGCKNIVTRRLGAAV